MIRKKMILSIILTCVVLLSGCFQWTKHPRYKIEEQDNGQYIITSPDEISYMTFEDNIWFPVEILIGYDYGETIGKCDLGYIYETKSEICIFTDDLRGSTRYTFFLADTVLPELSIENINNTVLESNGQNESKVIVDEQMVEKLIELYNDSETHEIKDIGNRKKTWELVMECEQFEELYFSRPIYKIGTDYYIFISFKYDSKGYRDGAILSKCTSVIKDIQ